MYWLTRMMAHFPKVDSTKGAIIMGDLSAEVVKNSISLCAVAYVCEDSWKSAGQKTSDDPERSRWPPQSGDLLRSMLDRMKMWQGYYDRLLNPKPQLAAPAPKPPEPPKYGAEYWNEMDQENRARLMVDLKEYEPFLRDVLLRSYRVPDGVYDQYLTQTEGEKND